MGRIFEENGELREEQSFFGFTYSTPAGELHENWDGSRETRNVFGDNFKIEKDNSFLAQLGEIVSTAVPLPTNPPDQIVKRSDGETGRMVYNDWRGRREYHPDRSESPVGTDYRASSGVSAASHNPDRRGTAYRPGGQPAEEKKEEKYGLGSLLLDGITLAAGAILLIGIVGAIAESGKKK